MAILFEIACSISGANAEARAQVCGQLLIEKGDFSQSDSNLQFVGQFRRPDVALGRSFAMHVQHCAPHQPTA